MGTCISWVSPSTSKTKPLAKDDLLDQNIGDLKSGIRRLWDYLQAAWTMGCAVRWGGGWWGGGGGVAGECR